MKRSFLMLALSFIVSIPFAVQAQAVFPLADLQKMTAKNASDFETLMLEKDYSIQPKQSNPTTKLYQSDKPGPLAKKYTITRHQVPGAAVNLTFVTTDKKFYLDLKGDLAKSGFKFINVENKTVNGVASEWYNYSNKVYTVSLNSNTTDVTWFTVQVHI